MFTPPYGYALAQMVGAVGLLGLLLVMPPARGTMLLQPVAPHAGQGIAAIAIAAGAVPVGRTAQGALIVRGQRFRLAPAMLRHGVIPLAAPDRLCGSVAERRT